MIVTRDERFESAGESLAGSFILAEEDVRPTLLFLHGAGKATKERALPLAIRLAELHRLSSFTFDFSGHGESTGDIGASSLNKRLCEAKAALTFAGIQAPMSVCAFSMGAHIGLELAALESIRALVLFYPAVYSQDAVAIPFGSGEFSRIIRHERSWAHSDVFERLGEFTGNLLLITGENDHVIPAEVPELLLGHAHHAATRRRIVIPDAPHLMLPLLFEREDLLDNVCQAIHESVSGPPRSATP